ncbi:MAG: DMT family transporter [Planctomycetes bacterium]|nr:DMT family transporter [Planctomycetota bacterium]
MQSSAVFRCSLAALLFGAATPATKHLLGDVGPVTLAGSLYLGAAAAVAPIALAQRRAGSGARADRRNLVRLGGAVIAGGIVAPVALLLGLRAARAADVSLWLQLEIVATAVLAAAFFREHLGPRTWTALAVVVAGGVLLAAPQGFGTIGAAALVGLACIGWGIDNNLTSLVDRFTPAQTTFVKGLVAGTINLSLGLASGEALPGGETLFLALAVGALSYGASIALYVSAAQELGATRSQLVFATAPVAGAVLSWVALGEPVQFVQCIAAAVMAAGVVLALTSKHTHEHAHDATVHVHGHSHDDGHHAHVHPGLPPWARHSHEHEHEAMRHTHPHEPDLHHRHRHG